MSVIRQANLLGQQRCDVPHLRAMESAVAGDFDVLAGRAMAGSQPLVLKGLAVSDVAIGAPASGLQVVMAGAVVFSPLALASGTMLWVPDIQPNETLNPATNSRVQGGWAASSTNYLGLEYHRAADPATTDLVQFEDADTHLEVPKQVPLAQTLDYRLVISTLPFSSQPSLVPIARFTLDASSQVVTAIDCRPLMFRLASGGDNPQNTGFSGWTRKESNGTTTAADFAGGDRGISSLKSWQDAAMTRLWELGGGEYWYAATADRNVQLTTHDLTLANGEYFSWDLGGQLLTWKNLRLLFDNSTSYNADIQDELTGKVILPGQVLYVDVQRDKFYAPTWAAASYLVGDLVVNGGLTYQVITAGTSVGGPTGTGSDITDGGTSHWKYIGPGVAGGLVGQIADLQTLGPGDPPGSRWILAWRRGTEIFTRGWRYAVGTTFQPATTTSLGEVKLNKTPKTGTSTAPFVVSIGVNGTVVVDGLDSVAGGGYDAITGTGGTSTAGTGGNGGTFNGGLGAVNGGNGLAGYGGAITGAGAGSGGYGTLGFGSAAVLAGQTGGAGMYGLGGAGVAGATAGMGAQFFAGAAGGGTGNLGSDSLGTGNAGGSQGTAAGNGDGAIGRGGAGTGSGLRGYGGATNGYGATVTGGGANGGGCAAYGYGTGIAVVANSAGSGIGVESFSNTGRAFESVKGNVGVPTTNKFEFVAARTGVIILGAADFIRQTNAGSTTQAPLPKDGTFNANYYKADAATQLTLFGTVRVPRGARITNIHIWLKDLVVAGQTLPNPDVFQMKYDTSQASGVTRNTILTGGNITAVPASGYGWYATGAVTTGAAQDAAEGVAGDGNSSWVEIYWTATADAGGGFGFGGMRITYTYTEVDFGV